MNVPPSEESKKGALVYDFVSIRNDAYLNILGWGSGRGEMELHIPTPRSAICLKKKEEKKRFLFKNLKTTKITS